VLQPHSLKLDGKYPEEALAAQQFIAQAQADVMVVAAYGLILPQWVLDAPRLGCLNIHASLLPRWRGAAPIHRAIEAGDVETGITIMQMDAGLDTGDMLLKETWPISPLDTTATLHDALASMGAQMIVKALSQVGQFTPVKQPEEGVTYAHKIEKSEAALDWTQSAEVLARRVRAFDPFPGMSTQLGDEVIKIWQAHALNANASANPQHAPLAGTILTIAETGIQVACCEGVLCLTQLQKPGGKRQPVSDFVRSFKGAVGDVFKA
jgi:methionyl-tRNA formyltransferase